jgi:hypothetical protein
LSRLLINHLPWFLAEKTTIFFHIELHPAHGNNGPELWFWRWRHRPHQHPVLYRIQASTLYTQIALLASLLDTTGSSKHATARRKEERDAMNHKKKFAYRALLYYGVEELTGFLCPFFLGYTPREGISEREHYWDLSTFSLFL